MDKETQKSIRKLVDESLSRGWRVTKRISSGGFFSEPTYDDRVVYNREDLWKLNSEGFKPDNDLGALAINILLKI